ncbi:zinc finger protein 862-like isoform X2 [Argopecten irradians]
MEAIEPEWTRLKMGLSTKSEDFSLMTWESAYQSEGTSCPNLFHLIDYLLSLPSSSVDAERGFSVMKQVKNDWRSRLGDRNLSDLMMVILETPAVEVFDPLPAIHFWNNEGQRVRRPYYKDDMKNCIPVQDQVVFTEEGIPVDDAEHQEAEELVNAQQSPAFTSSYSSDEEEFDDNFSDLTALQMKAYRMLMEL